MNKAFETSDLLVFSMHRWDFVYQRPQHLLSRHAQHRRVYYFEEPVLGKTEIPRLEIRESSDKVQVVVPFLPEQIHPENIPSVLRDLVDRLIRNKQIEQYTICYYDSNALTFSDHLEPSFIIFDCLGESATTDQELFKISDIVFTGSHSLFEASQHQHKNIHPFPSSVDLNIFTQGRLQLVEPEDQINIPHPRLGFYGIIDEKFDADLLGEMASLRPDFQFVILGPVINREITSLPQGHNIHYLGKKDYHSLPLYLASWDCAIQPYVVNDSTRFFINNSTPEFLAAGKPVVSTALTDIINPYRNAKLIHIAHSAEKFIEMVEMAMREQQYDPEWLERVDHFFESNSWDVTFEAMSRLESDGRRIRQTKFYHPFAELDVLMNR